eukprot:4212762-Amphidinium_carterae.1
MLTHPLADGAETQAMCQSSSIGAACARANCDVFPRLTPDLDVFMRLARRGALRQAAVLMVIHWASLRGGLGPSKSH